MKIKDFVYASTISEAYAYLGEIGESACFFAGGTSSFFIHSKKPKVAIDITRIPLKGITRHDGTFTIGACTTVNEIMKYREPGWVLDRVAVHFVTQQMRNISTLGGNLARIFYWSDFPVALQVLEGTISIFNGTPGTLPLSETLGSAAHHAQALKKALLCHIHIPVLVRGMGFGYVKEKRTSAALSSATAAAFVRTDNGTISDIRISIGAVVTFPARLRILEGQLRGRKAEGSSLEDLDFTELKDISLSPREGMTMEYCRHLLKVRITDVIREALNEAGGQGNA